MSTALQQPLWSDSDPSTPSSAASLASPPPWLESALAVMITAISGRNTPDSFAWLDPDGWWRKTLAGYVAQTFLAPATEGEEITVSLAMYCATWPRWGIARDGVVGKLRTPARPTGAKGSLSWPTPLASEADTAAILSDNHEYRRMSSGNYRKYTANGSNGSVGLSRLVRLKDAEYGWPTPQRSVGLNTQTVLWSTPAAQDSRNATLPPSQARRDTLVGDVMRQLWQTPRSVGHDAGPHDGRPDSLYSQMRALHWPTPRASASENRTTRTTPSQSKGHGRYLSAEVVLWATPMANDAKNATLPPSIANFDTLAGNLSRMWHTPNASDGEGGRVAKEVSVTGKRPDGSKANTTLAQDMRHAGDPGDLNPDWEELLMGFPVGWTSPGVEKPQPWSGWPSLPQEEQHDYEPPRTLPRKRDSAARKIRNERIKALGNAVVPAQAAPIFAAINAIEGAS